MPITLLVNWPRPAEEVIADYAELSFATSLTLRLLQPAFRFHFSRLAEVMKLRYSGSAVMATEISKRLFTVHDYMRMVDAGILSEDDRVELIRGEVLAMSPIGPPHNGAVLRATNGLVPLVGNRAIVGIQGAIQLDLIIETADSSLDFDRTVKASLYAETGVPEYWVADITNDCLWVYSGLEQKAYLDVREFHRGERIAPKLLPDCQIPVELLLP